VKSKDFSALPLAKVRFVEPMYALRFRNSLKARNGSTKSNLMATDALRAEIQLE